MNASKRAAVGALPPDIGREGARKERFARLVQPHLGLLLWHALRLTSNREDAEDLRQETLLKAFQAFHRYRDLNSPRGWLLKIMTNTHISEVRRRRRSAELAPADTLDRLAGRAVTSAPDHCLDPQALVLRQELAASLCRAVRSLPDHHQEVVELCDLCGLTYEEASLRIGCPVGTVRSRLHRGRERLKDQLLHPEGDQTTLEDRRAAALSG